MLVLTKAQRKALFNVFQRDFPSWRTPRIRVEKCRYRGLVEHKTSSFHYRRFRRQVQPSFDGTGCIMLPWHGMWLGIEKDGYTHS